MNNLERYAITFALVSMAVLVGTGSYFLSAVVKGSSLIVSVVYALSMTSMSSFIMALLFKNYTENVGGEE